MFSGISAKNVLLNFSSATGLKLSSYVAASVLAPSASGSAPGPGHLDGTFIGSFTSAQYTFNSAPFIGTLPSFNYATDSATPEPGSTALVGMSLIGTALCCSKTRKK